MLNSGKKICASRDKKINILTLVLSEKKILNETKNHNNFDFQNITAERVEKIINTINIKKATGADNIPAKVVRQCKVTVRSSAVIIIDKFIYKHWCISRLFESSSGNSHTQKKLSPK